MLNAIEPGTEIPIHRHPEKDESFVVLRGKVRSTTYKDDGSVIESVVLCPEDGLYGVDIPQGVWHKHPRDNAIAERVNGILKTEWLYDDHFQGLEDAYKRVAQVINPSNHKQPPLSLNHQTPAPGISVNRRTSTRMEELLQGEQA